MNKWVKCSFLGCACWSCHGLDTGPPQLSFSDSWIKAAAEHGLVRFSTSAGEGSYPCTLVWKRLLTGMRPLLSNSMPTLSRPRFWVNGLLPMQTSRTSHVSVSFFPPAAATTLQRQTLTFTNCPTLEACFSSPRQLTPRLSCRRASWWPPGLWCSAWT